MVARRARVEAQSDDGWLDDVKLSIDTSWASLSREAQQLDDEGLRLAVPAPNAIEWTVGSQWCNAPSVYEYTRQYQVIRDFFELRCPICNKGGTEDGDAGDTMPGGRPRSRYYLEGEVLLVWSADLEDDECPKCGTTRMEFIEDGFFRGYNQFHLIIGQRAGKSVVSAVIGTYVEHRLLTLALNTNRGLHGYFDVTHAEVFEMTFVAATAVQSSDTIWAKYAGLRGESPWFQRIIPWLKRQELMQVVPDGMKPWFYKETDSRIVNMYPGVRLIINSLNSNAPGLRGRTRPAAFADEISHMNQTDSKQSATEIYRALERSLRTVRSRAKKYGGLPWLGVMGSVSSPVSRHDKGMELLRTSDRVPSMYAKHYPTWEFNPNEPRENFDEEFEKDPVGAWRDYGAKPPGAEYPLIHNEQRFKEDAVDFDATSHTQFEIYDRQSPTGHKYVAARIKRLLFPRDGIPRYVVFDAGQNWDQFGGACAHGETVIDDEGRRRTYTVFDWVLRILPRPGVEVFFDSALDIVKRMRLNVLISRVEFDRWQSTQLIQRIREMNIFSEQKNTADKDYVRFRNDAYSGLIRMLPPLEGEADPASEVFEWAYEPPELSPQSIAIYEALGAQLDPDTHKVSFPEKGKRRGYGSNDVFQCCVHAHRLVQAAAFTERHDDKSRRSRRARAEHSGQGWENRGGLAKVPRGIVQPRNWMKGRGW